MIQLTLLDETVYDSAVFYAFRNKNSGRFVGYDGYDTTFSRGMSDIVEDNHVLDELNKKLVVRNHEEIVSLLTKPSLAEWKSLGGFDNIEVVRFEIEGEGVVFSPDDLLSLIAREDTKDDYCEDDRDG